MILSRGDESYLSTWRSSTQVVVAERFIGFRHVLGAARFAANMPGG
jgi:hypothetical protein